MSAVSAWHARDARSCACRNRRWWTASSDRSATVWRLGDRAQVHGWLRARIREDFSAGRTVTVDGWVLADTEARLYALAAHA